MRKAVCSFGLSRSDHRLWGSLKGGQALGVTANAKLLHWRQSYRDTEPRPQQGLKCDPRCPRGMRVEFVERPSFGKSIERRQTALRYGKRLLGYCLAATMAVDKAPVGTPVVPALVRVPLLLTVKMEAALCSLVT